MVEAIGITIDRRLEKRPKKKVDKLVSAWVQVTNATLNFGIIYQKKGVAYVPLLSVKY